jgi:hypothetical protein
MIAKDSFRLKQPPSNPFNGVYWQWIPCWQKICGWVLFLVIGAHMSGCALGGAAPAAAAGVAVAEYGKYKQGVRERLAYLHQYEADLKPKTAEAIARKQLSNVITEYQKVLNNTDYRDELRAEAAYQMALIDISALNPSADLGKGILGLEQLVSRFPSTQPAVKAQLRLQRIKATQEVVTGQLNNK